MRAPSGLRKTDSPVRRSARSGPAEDPHPLGGPVLGRREERPHEVRHEAQRRQPAEISGQEEPGVRQAERHQHEQVDGRRVVRDVHGLCGRERSVLVDHHPQTPDAQHRARRQGRHARVQAARPEQRQAGDGHERQGDRGNESDGDGRQRREACPAGTARWRHGGGRVDDGGSGIDHDRLRQTTVCIARLHLFTRDSTGCSSN